MHSPSGTPMNRDYKDRSYLSAIEAANLLAISVRELHRLTRKGRIRAMMAASGQMRYDLKDIARYGRSHRGKGKEISRGHRPEPPSSGADKRIRSNGTVQRVIISDSTQMKELEDSSVHLMVTSPPYFDAKMYSMTPQENDLGNVHDLDEWFDRIRKVWAEVYRVLQPGRKAFINIMNLPVRADKTFRSLNLVGRTIDVCEEIGFVFKRDIVWQKTNGVKAHFGTYPYPGGILLNHMHEFILEFQRPDEPGRKKYAHLTEGQREASRLDKDFWLSLKNSDVWLMNPERSADGRKHVAPFPEELPHRIIRAYSFVGETVLDPFLGSGTALRVAAGLGRNGIGYEIDPDIAADAVRAIRGNGRG